MYKVVNRFRDTQDNDRFYEVGDEYPKGDYQPTSERIKELSTVHSKYKKVFIVKHTKHENNPETVDEKEGTKKEVKKTKKTPSK